MLAPCERIAGWGLRRLEERGSPALGKNAGGTPALPGDYRLQLISSDLQGVVDSAQIPNCFGLSRRKFMCASPAAGSSLILLWAGEDPAFYQALTDSLNAV